MPVVAVCKATKPRYDAFGRRQGMRNDGGGEKEDDDGAGLFRGNRR